MAALATLAPVTRARNAARDTQTQPSSSPRANNPGVRRRNALLSSVVGTVLSGGGKLDVVRADEEALPRPTRPASCVAGTSCVSTASFRSPANYLPPWEYVGDDAQAFKTLVDALRSKPKADVTVVDANAGYVAASLRHDDSSSDVDDLEFFFLNDGSGAVRALERIASGYQWKRVAEPLICKGELEPVFLDAARELGQTLAAGIAFSIF